MAKNKALLPSMREKKRYIAFELISDKPEIKAQSVQKAVLQAVSAYLGKLGAAEAGVIMLKERYDEKKNKGILRCAHKYVDQVKAALAFRTEIDKAPVIFRTLGVSGIIKKAHAKYMSI